ncbi:MAG: TadE/TadG family type IV pilus assembly protein [Bryobacteraceae bacterium]
MKRSALTERRHRQRGNALLEMTLIFVPLIFLLLSSVELARAMWAYHTLAMSVKQGARFAIVHGARCVEASTACRTTIGDLAQVVQKSAIGLDPANVQLTLAAASQIHTCDLAACLGQNSPWPPAPNNAVGLPVTINARYTFRSAMGIWWPGFAATSINFTAKSTEVIQF